MAETCVFFNDYFQQLGLGGHDWDNDVFKVILTTDEPTAADVLYAAMTATEVANGNGYTTAGETVANPGIALGGAVGTVDGDAVTWTASGGTIGPFSWLTLYNSTDDGLICYWACTGAPVTLQIAETYQWKPSNAATDGTIMTIQQTA